MARVVLLHWTDEELAERLERAFVDYKISKIDSTWSGLCFARRG